MFVAVGAWTRLGWFLDAQCALARAYRAVARPWLSGIESTRFALLRLDRSVLDWSPVIEHVPGVLHGSVSTAPARTADPICHVPIVVTTGCFALFLPADSALPWTREERLIASRGTDFFPALCFISAIHPFFSSGMRLKSFFYALSRLA